MWCTSCQQDVPAYPSPEDNRIRCVKCRSEMISRAAEIDHGEAPVQEPASGPDLLPDAEGKTPEFPPFDFDAWEWDELREANRAVHVWGPKPPAEQAGIPQFDMATALPRVVANGPRVKKKQRPQRSRRFAYISWTTISLGIMACVFGGILLTWSFLTDRAELWSLGLPFAIGGQVALALGLVLQLDGLWQSNHEAAESLSQFDEQLMELRHATSQISTSHSGPSQSFYFHLAEGCSPHMLLADLKGQLDLLAHRIADQK
jgi:hypothetical protein